MYRVGITPVGTTEPPSTSSSSQQMLQPLHSTCTTSMKMPDAIMCHPALGNYNTTTNPSLMSRRKELGILEPGRPNFHEIPNVEPKRKWTSDSSTLDHSQLWLRRDQDLAPKLSPSIPVDPPKNTDARSKQFILSRLFQEISQAEPSRQWIDVHDKVLLDSNLQGRHAAAAGFRHDRNASASPSDHAMSEDHAPEAELRQARSPDVDELKRTGSISSEDVVDVESVRSGRGRSQSRNNNNNNNFTVSKNLVSERKRRKKLNDGLYSLRALVPKISKMDKASIVGDAIEHVKELQQQIEDIESEIAEMESECPGTSHTNWAIKEESGASRFSESEDHVQHGAAASAAAMVGEGGGEGACRGDALPATENVAALASTTTDDAISLGDVQTSSVAAVDQKRILKTEVSKLEDRTYQLQISCQKGPGVLVQLTKALESMDMDVLNAYHTSFQESILNTFIVEMRNLDVREAEDVRSTLLDVVAQHGLAAQS